MSSGGEHPMGGVDGAEEPRTVPLDDAPRSMSPEYAETNISVVREGIRRYGEPFLAYLILDGVEQRAVDLVEQYEARYVGYFPDRDSFTTWALERSGLEADLAAFCQEQGMSPADLRWDLAVLWERLSERYAVTERLGGVYAFRP